MRRFLPHLFWSGGLLLVIMGFVIAPVVRDGTPGMDLLSERQSEHLVMLSMTGCLFFVTGVLWIITRWLARRFSRKTVT
jgi:type VI protein secretion system component VasK